MMSVAGDDPKSTAAEKSGPKDPVQKGGHRVKRTREEDISGQDQKKQKTAAAAAAAGGRSQSEGKVKFAARAFHPTSGKQRDWRVTRDSEGKLRKVPAGGFLSDLPTLTSKIEDAETVESIKSLEDSDMVMENSRSIVKISSIDPDGTVLYQCTGIVFEFDEASKTAKILTSSLICINGDKLWHPKQQVSVHLSNDTSVKAHFLFFNDHYQIALLQIVTEHPLVPASFGSRPHYEQEVFILGRNEDYYLVLRRASILRLERPFLGRNHYMFSSADCPVACTGGPVINKDGEVLGMIATHSPQGAIVSITTVIKCIKMWCQFGRIDHPVHDLELKAVRMLNIYRRDELFVRHNIRSGFIVDEGLPESTAETIGIRRGDVIDVMSPNLGTTVSELEDNLLELSWQSLEKKLDPLTVDLEIEVHNLYDRESMRTVLPMKFNDVTVGQHDSLEFEVIKQ